MFGNFHCTNALGPHPPHPTSSPNMFNVTKQQCKGLHGSIAVFAVSQAAMSVGGEAARGADVSDRGKALSAPME